MGGLNYKIIFWDTFFLFPISNGMKIQENILLKDFTTFKVGGRAKYFAVVKSIDDLKQAVGFAKRNQLPVFVLGDGSNLLVSDEGVDGLVLKMEINGISIFQKNDFLNNTKNYKLKTKNYSVIAGAGETWDELVEKCVEKGFYGLENLSFIPGTVGASVVQNIGAYGVEVKDVVSWVEVFDIETGEIKKLSNKDCGFGYRDSVFKKPEGKNLVVIRVAYNLQKNGKLNLDYKDIQDYIVSSSLRDFPEPNFSTAQRVEPLKNSAQENRGNPVSALNPKKLREIIIQIRRNKLPDWKKVGTAGSFFKNPIITKEQLEKILEKYPNLPNFKQKISKSGFYKFYKISLAYVLDKILGLKGLEENGVGLYENQPLVIVNKGKAKTEDIKNFAQKIQKRVKDELGIIIEFEVVEW